MLHRLLLLLLLLVLLLLWLLWRRGLQLCCMHFGRRLLRMMLGLLQLLRLLLPRCHLLQRLHGRVLIWYRGALQCQCGSASRRRITVLHGEVHILVITRKLRELVESSPCGNLIPILVQNLRHFDTRLDELVQQRHQCKQSSVVGVIIPRANEDAIVRLQHEVLLHIVNNERSVQVTAYSAQILGENWTPWKCMLTVQTVVDQSAWVDLVNNPVSIILSCCSEDNELVAKHGHPLQELVHAWSNAIVPHAIKLKVMH
mmetsp:Transcript_17978/g.41678  ORF Transcript_17978/g.41678 Transcript_17978/m.41678 type:complete len:257 (-) Transcript_17978:1380-2150(-)